VSCTISGILSYTVFIDGGFLRERRLFIFGLAIIGSGIILVRADGIDPLRAAATVAAIVGLVAQACRPQNDEQNEWSGYLSVVTLLAALIVIAFFFLPKFISSTPKTPATNRSVPRPERTPQPKKVLGGHTS
jgi:hypothetical protein